MSKIRKSRRISGRRFGMAHASWLNGLRVGLLTFVAAMLVSLPSQSIMAYGLDLRIALPLVLLIILIGIIADMVGVAIAVADEAPFNAMSAKKIRGSRQALKMIKNADKVSSFLNDLVGDVAGTVSGAAGTAMAVKLSKSYEYLNIGVLGMIVVGIIAGLTVGGKAVGKGYAIRNANQITRRAGEVIAWLEERMRVNVLGNDLEKRSNARKK